MNKEEQIFKDEEKAEVKRANENKPTTKALIMEWVKPIGIAICLGLLISTIVKPTVVKGYSMAPTIQPQDYLIISKLPYLAAEPKRGDIVVFHTDLDVMDGDKKTTNGSDFIKRVIGVEGDIVEIKNGQVYLNEKLLEEEYLHILSMPYDMDPVNVSKGHIFVMGDNRNSSLDSRNPELGEIDINEIWGRADLRLFPFNRMGSIND